MADLDRVLDDALAGFDEDEQHISPSLQPGSSSVDAASCEPSARPQQQQDSGRDVTLSNPAASTGLSSSAAGTSSISTGKPASGTPGGRMQFDPLKRKKGKAPAASTTSSSSSRPALTPEVFKLQDDLAKLVSDWSEALHPEAAGSDAAGLASAAAGGQHPPPLGVSSVLQALAQQTQRTVEQQSRSRPPPAATAAAAAAAEGGGGSSDPQMSMIVDVVMQHLLSKDVLYQPMKEIMEKYPPWLEKQEAAASSSSSSSSSSSLSAADLERYRQQYACITRLCHAYETEPTNTSKIMTLLQEMQACGEPPEDIVQEMSSAIAADLPDLAAAGADLAGGRGGLDDLNFENLNLDDLGDVPDLKNCPVQ